MNNESCRLALNDVINPINNAKRCQNDIDDLHDLFWSNITNNFINSIQILMYVVNQLEKGIEKVNYVVNWWRQKLIAYHGHHLP